MKKLLTLFMCFALVGLYSCGSDDDDDNGGGDSGITIKARVLYSTDADGVNTSPDAGAKVYVFYDLDFNNANVYVYQVGGKYVNDGKTLTPDQTATIGTDGNAVIEQKFKNRKITVVIDSKHYQGQYSELYYPNFNENIVLSNIFKLK